jgi:hypothetical protein
MNSLAQVSSTHPSTSTVRLIARILQRADFPATGAAIVQLVAARHGPDDLVAALRRLTPGKTFHNVYEVWFDALDSHVDRQKAAAASEAAQLSKL